MLILQVISDKAAASHDDKEGGMDRSTAKERSRPIWCDNRFRNKIKAIRFIPFGFKATECLCDRIWISFLLRDGREKVFPELLELLFFINSR